VVEREDRQGFELANWFEDPRSQMMHAHDPQSFFFEGGAEVIRISRQPFFRNGRRFLAPEEYVES